jgi:hypothetical protein
MTCHWIGAARRAGPEDFARAAEALACPVAAIRAVWDVECSGGPFRADGSLERRFEPHKLRRPDGTWRSSALLSAGAREAKFAAAFAVDHDDALRATSWGGPQIMGFNAGAAGYASTSAMVEAMADDEGAQVGALVALIRSWGLAAPLRAGDWRGFAARYNGGANVAGYAARIEAAHQRRCGGPSAVVLRWGDSGPAVRRLQEALAIAVDGCFGWDTDRAVRDFQKRACLQVDGIVGPHTWSSLALV